MQRWTLLGFGLVVVAAVALLFVRPSDRGGAASPSATASASVAPSAQASAGPSDAGVALIPPSDAGFALANPGSSMDTPLFGTTDAGATLLNGEAPPKLTGDTPKSVTFGVILVEYRGSQGAKPNARTREEAMVLAKQLAEDAKTDFKAAVAKGDPGSKENLGKISQGFLEPAPEFILFSLPKDGVSDPVDTPRGFWIVKRID
jgi:hypothetical protein